MLSIRSNSGFDHLGPLPGHGPRKRKDHSAWGGETDAPGPCLLLEPSVGPHTPRCCCSRFSRIVSRAPNFQFPLPSDLAQFENEYLFLFVYILQSTFTCFQRRNRLDSNLEPDRTKRRVLNARNKFILRLAMSCISTFSREIFI